MCITRFNITRGLTVRGVGLFHLCMNPTFNKISLVSYFTHDAVVFVLIPILQFSLCLSVDVRKLQIAIIARSSREMSQIVNSVMVGRQ